MFGQLFELPLRGACGNQVREMWTWSPIAARGDVARHHGPLAKYAMKEYGPGAVEWLRSQAHSDQPEHLLRQALVSLDRGLIRLRQRASIIFSKPGATPEEVPTRLASRDAHPRRRGAELARGRSDSADAHRVRGSSYGVTERGCSCDDG